MSVFPCVPPEEQGHRSGACMASDRCPNTVDYNFSIQLWKTLFYHIRHFSRIIVAVRMGYKTLSGVIQPVLCKQVHFLYDLPDYFLLSPDLKAGDQVPGVIHVEQRTDLQRCSKPTGNLGYTAPFYIKGEIC